ncbi:lytic murein transglycosylase B [Chitinimonas koreensis]|nr:lytic murein transglycosylase B [Chitinimonas koreensis]
MPFAPAFLPAPALPRRPRLPCRRRGGAGRGPGRAPVLCRHGRSRRRRRDRPAGGAARLQPAARSPRLHRGDGQPARLRRRGADAAVRPGGREAQHPGHPRPPSTSRPYYAFRPNFVNDQRIRLGVAWWREHAALLDAVSARYGVEPEYLVAILGVETMWGRNTGTFRVMDALSTVAFGYPRRAEFFRKELREFLLLARDEGVSPFSFRGSYAGAMGMPQFMPSSFHAYAQDWNGDGRHDIWNDTGDILASIAHYFVQHGWQAGRPLVVPAAVEGDAYGPLVEDKFNLHYRVSELAAFGVRPAAPLAGDPLAVLAPLEGAPGVTNYWLGLGNFYAITRYNRSTLYAMAVHELAMATKAAYLDPSLLPPEPKPARKAKPQRAKPNKGKAKPAAVHKGKKK